MTSRDEKELLWWREVFACRFQEGDIPKVGRPLYGSRLKVYVSTGKPRGWTPWRDHDQAQD